MDDPSKQAKAKAAAAYDAFGLLGTHWQADVERIALSAGAHVLDVGCGTGASALQRLKQLDQTGLWSVSTCLCACLTALVSRQRHKVSNAGALKRLLKTRFSEMKKVTHRCRGRPAGITA